MRCQACDYELWHCTGRVCPECGDVFSLKDFEFELDTVLFHCPHCNRGVEGQGVNGWPDLNIEQCDVCGLAIGLDYYIVRPLGNPESPDASLPIHTDEGNWFDRYFSTVWLVMTKPGRTMGRIPIHESLEKAWFFLLTNFMLILACETIVTIFVLIPLSRLGTPQGGSGVANILLLVLIQAIYLFIFMPFYIIAWAVITHLLLLMTGGGSFTFRRTLQAILYSGGASIVSIVPCFGGITGIVWWNVSAINMISKGQRVGGGRASFAVLSAPFLLTFCICCGFGILSF